MSEQLSSAPASQIVRDHLVAADRLIFRLDTVADDVGLDEAGNLLQLAQLHLAAARAPRPWPWLDDAALTVDCPYCAAPPGWPCITAGRAEAWPPHVARRAAVSVRVVAS